MAEVFVPAAIPHRRWRNNEEGAQSLVNELQSMRKPLFRTLRTEKMLNRMRGSIRAEPDEAGVFHYDLFAEGLQRFPKRFLDVF